MSDTKSLKKDQSLCIVAIGLILGCFGGLRLIESFVEMNRNLSLVCAMVCTLALAVVYFIVSKTSNAFYGLLASLIGYKMMPPIIPDLINYSADGAVLYYVVRKIAVVLFVVLAIKFYRMQEGDDKIRLIPILAIMAVVPFVSEIATVVGNYLSAQLGGSLIYLYATQFSLYIVATMVVLGVAMKSNYSTLRFTAYYEFVALSINILKRAGLAVAWTIKGIHVSKSYFVWIAIFAVLIAVFAVVKDKRKKEELAK